MKLFTFISHNFGLKFTAVFLAIVFWFFVQSELTQQVQRNCRITLLTPQNIIVEGGSVREIKVTVRGPKAILAAYYIEDLPIEGTITVPQQITERSIRIRLHRQYLKNVRDRVHVEFEDPYINIVLHKRIKKRVPIRPILIGKPKKGFTVEKIIAEPPEIELEGGANELANIVEISNVPLNITDLEQSTLFEDISLDLSKLKSIRNLNQTIAIKLLIGEEKQNRRFARIPIKTVNAIFVGKFSPRTVTIEVQGTRGIINFVKSSDFQAVVDVKDIPSGQTVEKKVQVKIPPNTTLIETTPEWVKVTITNDKVIK